MTTRFEPASLPENHPGNAWKTFFSLSSREVPEQDYPREIALTTVLIALTLCLWGMATLEMSGILLRRIREADLLGTAGQVVFLLINTLLFYGNMVYQFTRLGSLRRSAAHRRAGREELERFYDGTPPSLVILVPSYKENPEVVRRTLLSAALQDYPDRKVVLLIDDPPNSASPADRANLDAMRALPEEVQLLLDGAGKSFGNVLEDYLARAGAGAVDTRLEGKALARHYRNAADWCSRMSHVYPAGDHGDALLVEKVFRESARAHREKARSILESAFGGTLSEEEIARQYRRLASLFRVRLSGFERKRYVNLSHMPNKAMNLNSYVGLIGKSFREVRKADGLHLVPAAGPGAERTFPDAEFLIMLDADSLLTPDYGIRMIHHMTQPGNERVAVAQTPYSNIPDSSGALERVAGATTDIQYIIHQGFTAYNATYWVGANALLRKAALDDIAEVRTERGFRVIRYIHDRTVIEDTESSIDLVDRGWSLYNYPERLAYSATPPDFGSLLIQRRRWANGGLLILPKLLRFLSRGPNRFSKAAEGFFRFHYLSSIAAVNFGLLILLAFPFEENLRTPYLPLTALPYFYLYGRDLVTIGYRWTDLLRVYALNLLLIPVNLGGVLSSIHQGITGRNVPFARTPKVVDRTAAPAFYILAEFAMVLLLFLGFAKDVYKGYWVHAAFSLANLAFLAYAIVRFIGLKESREDLALGLGFRVQTTREAAVEEPSPVVACR